MTTANLLRAAKRAGLSIQERADGRIKVTGPGGSFQWHRMAADPEHDCRCGVYYLRGGEFDDFTSDHYPGVYVKTIRRAIELVRGARL